MGLFNQGWGCRCDYCGEQALGELGGLRQLDVIRVAKINGWIQRKEKWFCSEYCRAGWLARGTELSE